jgi:hypothetical protein
VKWLRIVLPACALSCDASSVYYLYYADAYEPTRDCIDSPAPLDVFSGTDPGSTCSVKCLSGIDDDGGAIVYTSTMCGPAPVGADTSGTSPMCPGALAALARGDFCLDGGGSTNPADAKAD